MASTYAPPSPVKLPAYKPPRLEAQRPPSPIANLEGNDSSLIAPKGCELMIHNVQPTGTLKTSEEVLNLALQELSKKHQYLLDCPVQYSFSLRDTPSVCTIKLRCDVAGMDNIPRPDLLDQWIEPLRSYNAKWHVDWACSAPNKERRLWVGVKGFSTTPTRELGDKIRTELQKMSFRTVGSFVLTGSNAVVLNMATLEVAKKLLEKKTLTIPNISTRPLSLENFKTIQPEYAFELGVTGIDHYDPTIALELDAFFSRNYLDNDGSTLWYRSRVVDGVYLFLMKDWNATARVLRDKETFEKYSKDSDRLMYPRLLYDLNTNGRWSESIVKHLKTATTAVGGELNSLAKKVQNLERRVDQGFSEAENRFSALTSNVQVLTTNISSLQTQVQNQSYAMLTMREQHLATEQKMLLSNYQLQLKMRLGYAEDDEKDAIKAEIKTAQAQLDQLEHDSRSLSRAFDGFIVPSIPPPPGPQAGLPAPPQQNATQSSSPSIPVIPTPAIENMPVASAAPVDTQAPNAPIAPPIVATSPAKRLNEEGGPPADKSKRHKPATTVTRKTRNSRSQQGLQISSQIPEEDVQDSQDDMDIA